MAAGFHCSTVPIQSGLSCSMMGMENITPDAYIHVRITNGMSCARSGVFEPARAMIRARPVLKRNCRTRIGTISAQDRSG